MTVIPDLDQYLPTSVANLANPQTDIPRIAKDKKLLKQIESAVKKIPTSHRLIQGDSRKLSFIKEESSEAEGLKGKFTEPNTEFSFTTFATSLSAHAMAYAKMRKK